MSITSAMSLSASGLRAERVRLNAASSNLANAHTTRTEGGGPYRRLDPVLAESEDGGVEVRELREDQSGGQRVYLPDHPDADREGMVRLPNVDPIHEVVNLISAQRGFEANATAFETARTMAERALDLMR